MDLKKFYTHCRFNTASFRFQKCKCDLSLFKRAKAFLNTEKWPKEEKFSKGQMLTLANANFPADFWNHRDLERKNMFDKILPIS